MSPTNSIYHSCGGLAVADAIADGAKRFTGNRDDVAAFVEEMMTEGLGCFALGDGDLPAQWAE